LDAFYGAWSLTATRTVKGHKSVHPSPEGEWKMNWEASQLTCTNRMVSSCFLFFFYQWAYLVFFVRPNDKVNSTG
jgi:hypothetical protein